MLPGTGLLLTLVTGYGRVHMDNMDNMDDSPHASPAFAQASLHPPIGKVFAGFPQSRAVSRALRSLLRTFPHDIMSGRRESGHRARLSRHTSRAPTLSPATRHNYASSHNHHADSYRTVNGPLLVLERSTPGQPAKCSLLLDLGMPVLTLDTIFSAGI